MSVEYPSQEWWNEATEYSNSLDAHVICPKCLWLEDPRYDYSNTIICELCNESIDEFGDTLNVSKILKNIEIFKKLDDFEFQGAIRNLMEYKYDCPECCSMDDEQYYCTSCENETITEAHRLMKEVNETLNDKDLAEKIADCIDKLR